MSFLICTFNRILLLLLGLLLLPSPSFSFIEHEIFDVQRDMDELDVGTDFDDMELDVTFGFREELHRKKWNKNPPKAPAPGADPVDLMSSMNTQTTMTFATMSIEWALEKGKEGTDEYAAMVKGQLQNAGVTSTVYSVDPGKLLFVTTVPGEISVIKKFMLAEPDVDFFEYQQKQYFPKGRSGPLLSREEREKAEIKAGFREPALVEKKTSKKDKKRKKNNKGVEL